MSAAALTALAACSPALDWREVRPDGADAVLLFPCKPEVARRAAMGLARCKAQGMEFALSWADLEDPARVTPALQRMREALIEKIGAGGEGPFPLQVPGMTPNPQALTQALAGAAGTEPRQGGRVALFCRGTRVYQLVMLGAKADAAAWDSFVGSVRLSSS